MERPRAMDELTDELHVSKSLMRQHLRVLRAARLVTAERHGEEGHDHLADGHVAHALRDAFTHARSQ